MHRQGALSVLAGMLAITVGRAAHAEPPASGGSNLNERVRSEVAQYADSDHVYVTTPSIAGSVSSPTSGWNVDGSYLVDVVSAASVDIVSTASRRWEEVRQAGALSAGYKPGTLGVAADASFSDEPDYLAFTAGGSVTQELFEKNVTWMAGYDFGHDVTGRSGTPFSVYSHLLDRHSFKGALTFVLDRATLLSFVGDVIVESGDPSKPYRYIPLFAPGTVVPIGAPASLVNRLRVSERPIEQLPLSRDRFALSGRLARRFGWSTLRLEERFYADSWELFASTTEARYLFDLGRIELGPHARLHAQTPVSFWQRAYLMGPNFTYPALRTGDRELGPLVNVTGGWSFQVSLGPAGNPRAWVLGLSLDATSTRYLDDLYITQRISGLGALNLEAEL